jgi:predicted acetyltransferase
MLAESNRGGNMLLVKPGLDHLPSYTEALRRGFSPDSVRGSVAASEEVEAIAADPAAFVARMEDLEARGKPTTMPDGTTRPRLPGFRRWMWDGEFCGSIGARWQPGTEALPEHVLGHVGYVVCEWKRGRGYAKEALRQLLPQIRAFGLAYIDLTTDPDNLPSQKVITANGGVLIERRRKMAMFGGGETLVYRIALTP